MGTQNNAAAITAHTDTLDTNDAGATDASAAGGAPPSAPPPDRAALLRRLGDRTLLGEVVDHLRRPGKNGQPPLGGEDLEEVVQNTFKRALAARQGWPPEDDPLVPWMIVIADRARVDLWRGKVARGKHEEPSELVDLHPREKEFDAVNALLAELGKDPDHAKTIAMWRAHAEGYSVAEVAAAHRMTESAVEKRLSRLPKHLRAIGGKGMTVSFAASVLISMLGNGATPLAPIVYADNVDRGVRVSSPQDVELVPPHRETAEEIRAIGINMYYHRRPIDCLEYLNRARKMDPKGDRDPKAVEARRWAEAEVMNQGRQVGP